MTPFPDVALALVREGVDLTMRQCAVLITVARAEEAQTVRGLAWDLNVSSPAITRAHTKLVEMGLLRVVTDRTDRRSVLITATAQGMEMAERMTGVPVRRAA